MKKHFVTFLSPGTFFNEEREKPIDSWDVEAARKMAASVVERYGARPYAFYFTTRERGDADLDSRVVATSGRYFLAGKVMTVADVKAANDPQDAILIGNMERNDIARIVRSDTPWRTSVELRPEDVVLEPETSPTAGILPEGENG